MKKLLLTCGALSLIAAAPLAQAASANYNVITTWYEPDTQPNNTIFIGSFTFDNVSHTVTNLHGTLSESMTDDNTTLTLDNRPLASWYDAVLQGTFAATFLQNNTNVFLGGGWSPAAGISAGWTTSGTGNAYALIFVPDSPLTSLTPTQINKLAYADCAPGGMMMDACMTGTSPSGYDSVGSMSGIPLSQVITLVPSPPVPEAESYAMLMAGLGLIGLIARRRRQIR